MMNFVIFQDLIPNTTMVKIHRIGCHHYTTHEPTTTTKWHEVEDLKNAKLLAEDISKNSKIGWRFAKCCTIHAKSSLDCDEI